MTILANAVYVVPNGWSLRTVDEIKAREPHSCVAGPFGSKISSKYFTETGVPVIRGSNLRNDLTRFVPEGFVFVSEDRAREYTPQHVCGNDLVFTCWGTIGQVGIVPSNGPFEQYIISNKQLKLRVDSKMVNPLYCFYYFASPRYVEHVRGRSIGGAIPGINLGILKSLTIALPDKTVQDYIVHVLSAYDDLIENNRRRTYLLEEAARLLYREWFVHLRFPGHEHVELVDGVPFGWRRQLLGQLANVRKGRNITKESAISGEVPVVGGGLKPAYFHNAANVVGPAITVSASGANAGHVGLYLTDIWASDCSFLSASDNENLWFLYFAMKTRQADITAMQQGAAQPHVYPKDLERLDIMVPPAKLRQQFEGHVVETFLMIASLQRQCDSLARARDLLLPRLMSGDLAV